jgi:hypothetical protein
MKPLEHTDFVELMQQALQGKDVGSQQTFYEFLEVIGVEVEAFQRLQRNCVRMAQLAIIKTFDSIAPMHTLFLLGFELGVRAEKELELRRLAERKD